MKKNWIRFIVSILVCQLAGFIGSQFTISSVKTWYPTLNKPFYNPPNWIFAPVWSILYVLMGISLYLVWKEYGKKKIGAALSVFFVQLFLNISWSIAFFGNKSIISGLIIILVLWVVISINIIQFKRISKRAGYLLIPYLIWVSFATLLNIGYKVLN